MYRIIVLLMVCVCGHAHAANYYVSTTGNDAAAGNFGAPFATIQKAADSVSSGDTVYIRGGSYHEEVVIDNLVGTAADSITFTAYNNEVVTLDGTQALGDLGSTGWTLHGGSIYKTTLTCDIWQLFDDGEMMVMARWPNAFLHDGSVWDQQGAWGRGDDASSSNGTMVDNANNGHDLAATGLDMTGAMGVMNVGSFRTWPRKVLSHVGGSNTFTYTAVPGSAYKTKLGYYYLECKLNLLDAAREWFYDPAAKTLYLWAPDGTIPSGNIRGKTQTYAFNISNSEYLTLDGLTFFGTTFNMVNSSSCTVENCKLQFPSFSKRMLGSEDNIEFTNMQVPANTAPGNTLRNCVFENSDGQAVRMSGAGCVIENNYFHNIDFSCAGLPNLGDTVQVEIGSSGSVIRCNTIDTAGASETIAPGRAGTVEYNRVTNVGLLQSDGAGVHRMVPEAPNSVTRYNWFHDMVKYSIRFDGDPGGTNGLVHHNVVWNSDTMRLKGDFHQVYNNFGFNGLSSKGIINIATDKGGNTNTVTRNNAADNISPATLFSDGDPLPGTESHNWNGTWTGTDIRDQIRDAENWDFRPKIGSSLIDAGMELLGITDGYLGGAPDIGAYEFGTTNYWIPGCKRIGASTPVPPNQADNVKTNADLMWLGGYQATSHNIYFGIESDSLPRVGNQSNNIFNPGTLAEGQTYYWRIDTVTPTGTVSGTEWCFRVEASDSRGTAVFTPTDDAYVQDTTPNTNYGDADKIKLITQVAYGYNREGYLTFNVDVPGTITSATLALHNSGGTCNAGIGIYSMSETAWNEDTLTWSNRPDVDGELLDFGNVDSESWAEFDVSSAIVSNGPVSFALIRDPLDTQRSIDSRETTNPPTLYASYINLSPAHYFVEWVDRYSVAEPGYYADPDGDGLSNLAEYGLGGLPNNPADSSIIKPTFKNMEYVYRRRTDADSRGLSYTLEKCTNLVSNDWNSVIHPPAGIGALDAGFESVTNFIPTTETNQFFRLHISMDSCGSSDF